MKISKIRSAALVLSLGLCSVNAETFTIKSPDNRSKLSITEEQGQLFYELSHDDKTIVGKSSFGIIKDAKYSVIDTKISQHDSTWKPSYGQFSTIRDNHTELKIQLKAGEMPLTLLARLFNNGSGLRFVIDGEAGKQLDFHCNFELLTTDVAYYPRGEAEPSGAMPLKRGGAGFPVLIERQSGKCLAILESDLYSSSAFKSMNPSRKSAGIASYSTATTQTATTLTPWRVIIFGNSAGELLTSNVMLNLAAPCELKDNSWVTPGKTLWDWRIHGYHNGDFVYGINTKSYFRLINFAAENNIQYLTIDDQWYKNVTHGSMTVAKTVDIKKVMAYAKEKNVKIILYYDRRTGEYGDEQLLTYYAKLGAAGIKYGTKSGIKNKDQFTRVTLKSAAKHKMSINYHDYPTPMVGVERTMPSLMTRESCHAQLDARKTFSPRSFLRQAMINGLIGPLDQANGNFGIKSINSGVRKKGPSRKNSYVSTVCSEAARTLVIYSGIITLPDAPEEYMKKADLFEFIKQMPATWDESIVPNSKVGEFITTARRSADTWFVGSVTNNEKRQLPIKCNFLKEGVTYEATLFEDTKDSHGVENPEAYQISTRQIKKGDVITASMAVGGGHCMIIKEMK